MSLPLAIGGASLGEPRYVIGPPKGLGHQQFNLDRMETAARRNAAYPDGHARRLGWRVTDRGRDERYPDRAADLMLAADVAIFQDARGLRPTGELDAETLEEMRLMLAEWRAAGQPEWHYGTWIARYLWLPGGHRVGLDKRTLRQFEPTGPSIRLGLDAGSSRTREERADEGAADEDEGLSTGAKIGIGLGLVTIAGLVWRAARQGKRSRRKGGRR